MCFLHENAGDAGGVDHFRTGATSAFSAREIVPTTKQRCWRCRLLKSIQNESCVEVENAIVQFVWTTSTCLVIAKDTFLMETLEMPGVGSIDLVYGPEQHPRFLY